MLKAFKKERVYIIKYILNSFNEFVLFSVMHIQSKSEIAFLEVCKNL